MAIDEASLSADTPGATASPAQPPARLPTRRRAQIWIRVNSPWIIEELDEQWSKVPGMFAVPMEKIISRAMKLKGPPWWRQSLTLEDLPAFFIAMLEHQTTDEGIDALVVKIGELHAELTK